MNELKTENNSDIRRFSPNIPIEIQRVISDQRVRSYKDSDYDAIALWMRDLARFYDGHDENNRLLDQLVGAEAKDNKGFFTKRKFIFVCDIRFEPAGMLCLNFKRGGSAKIGPLVVSPNHRGQGVGTGLLNSAEQAAIVMNVRKLYATTSHLNEVVNRLFEKAGYKIEARLPDQYKRGSIELIWGKHLERIDATSVAVQSVLLESSSTNGVLKLSTDAAAHREFINVANNRYKQWHDDLGDDFIDDMLAGTSRELFFQNKGKIMIFAEDENGEQGLMTYTPKRGGPVKIYPIYGTAQAQLLMMEKAIEMAHNNGNHKFYTFVHASDFGELFLLESMGFQQRGRIESPYKLGHDLIQLDMMIK